MSTKSTTTQIRPQSARSGSVTFQTRPQSTRNASITAQTRPQSSRNTSTTTQIRPQSSRNASTTSQIRPQSARNASITSQIRPQSARNTSITSQTFPKSARSTLNISEKETNETVELAKYCVNLIKYLYENQTEFILNQSLYCDMPGNYYCKIIGYNIPEVLTKENIKDIKYTIEINGYLSYFQKISNIMPLNICENAKIMIDRYEKGQIPKFADEADYFEKIKEFERNDFSDDSPTKTSNELVLSLTDHYNYKTLYDKLENNYLISALKITKKDKNNQIIPTNEEDQSIYSTIKNEMKFILPNKSQTNKKITQSDKKWEMTEIEFEFDGELQKVKKYGYQPSLFDTCDNMESKDDTKSQKVKFITRLKDVKNNKGKILNLNLWDDDQKIDAVSLAKERFSASKGMIYLTHNIQNKEAENGFASVMKQYRKEFLESSLVSVNNFRYEQTYPNFVLLFQEAGWKSLDETIYGHGQFMYTNCEIANGHLMVKYNDDKDDYDVYSHYTYRAGKQLKDKKYYQSMINNEIQYTDDDKINIINKLNVLIQHFKTIESRQSGGVMSMSASQPTRSDQTYIDDYLTKLEQIIKDKSLLKNSRINFHYKDIIQILKKSPQLKIDETKKIDEILTVLKESVFFHPQLQITEIKNNNYLGEIMVHDLTNYFEKGSVIGDKVTVSKRSRQESLKSLKSSKRQKRGGKATEAIDTAIYFGKRLFSISCDERMNFEVQNKITREKIGNDKKQLCTIFSSEFFDPRSNQDKSHVLLIAIETAGPDRNHVALVIANKSFTEVVINVHLESGGQGVTNTSTQFAITELNILLDNIIGSNQHQFFKDHKDTIENIRIFGDFNLTSNVIYNTLASFAKKQKIKDHNLYILMDRIKTHNNVKVQKVNDVNYDSKIPIKPEDTVDLKQESSYGNVSGCIDNVIYITKNNINMMNKKVEKIIVGGRKLSGKQYKYSDYKELSDHSPIVILENHNEIEASMDISDDSQKETDDGLDWIDYYNLRDFFK